jgi:CubicO group peptidase (beta-lactamase class C family)
LWIVGSLICLLAGRLSADEVDDLVEAARQRQRIPGLAVLVIHHGQTVKAQGYGLANIEHQVPVTPETVFQSGSMGKQFTATAVMMLIEEGKIKLDESIRVYLKDAPESWEPITIRHLLSHESGLGDHPLGFNMRRDYTEEQLLEIIFKSKLKFAPGQDWSYSNLGYMVLGAVIRQASGQFYGDFLRDRVFKPSGMTSTRIISEADIVPHRAAGYRLVKDELKNQEWVSPSLNTTADGSLYLTILDLARWDAALRGETLLKQATLKQMWTVAPVNDGRPNRGHYGFGWMCRDIDGHRAVEHGGAWQGFFTHIARYLDDELTVAVLTNLEAGSGSNPAKLTREVAGQYVPALRPPVRKPIDDPEPDVTAKIREQITRLAQGQADPEEFAGEARATIFPDHVADVKAQFGPLGTIRELTLVARTSEADKRALVYWLRFQRGPLLELKLMLTAEGKIAKIDAEAE